MDYKRSAEDQLLESARKRRIEELEQKIDETDSGYAHHDDRVLTRWYTELDRLLEMDYDA